MYTIDDIMLAMQKVYPSCKRVEIFNPHGGSSVKYTFQEPVRFLDVYGMLKNKINIKVQANG